MHILPYDYLTDRPIQTRGLARIASLIHEARAEAAAKNTTCLLVDNGDFLTGTPMDDAFAERMESQEEGEDQLHPMMLVMNRLGFDAGTLGNHDFDHGLAPLAQVLKQAEFPFVLSNLGFPPEGDALAPLLTPHRILTRQVRGTDGKTHSLRIGVIGFLPPQSIRPRRSLTVPPQPRDIVETARQLVPELRKQGADFILVLAHTGIGEAEHRLGQENALVPLSRIAGIDAIVGGHAHQVFPGRLAFPHPPGLSPETGHINGVPVVVPGFWGSHLGVIDLELTRDRRQWAVADNRVDLRAVFHRDADGQVQVTAPEDPDVTRALASHHERTLSHVRTQVGHSACRLHSYFSLVAPSAAVQLIQRAQRDFAARALRNTPYEGLPLLSSASALKCGGIGGPDHYTDVPAGELTLRAIADLYLFPNDLVVLKVTGEMVRNWLERAASVFNRLTPDRPDQPIIEQSTPGYLYETVLGLNYEIDLTQAPLYTPRGTRVAEKGASGRVRGLTLDETPLHDQAELLLVTNGFRASGGGYYPMPDEAAPVLDTGTCIRDVLRAYLRDTTVADCSPEPHWRLTAAPGTTATLDSSPRALSLINESERSVGGLHLSARDRLPSGFQQFRLTF